MHASVEDTIDLAPYQLAQSAYVVLLEGCCNVTLGALRFPPWHCILLSTIPAVKNINVIIIKRVLFPSCITMIKWAIIPIGSAGGSYYYYHQFGSVIVVLVVIDFVVLWLSLT